jgi:SAM-dependent methyltransferase
MTAEARRLRAKGRAAAALAAAWQAFDADPGDGETRQLVAELLREAPDAPLAGRSAALLSLVRDPDIEPIGVSAAAWTHLRRDCSLFETQGEALARRVQGDALAMALLEEAQVTDAASEIALTRLRRWLLEADRPDFGALCGALKAQAAINGGAWPFEESERALFAANADFAKAYLPKRTVRAAGGFDDATSREVAEHYEGWPFPPWRRISRQKAVPVAAAVRRFDPDRRARIPERGAEILIAGCGTGRQAAALRRRHPEARITAIDLSAASLDYARRRCAEIGAEGIEFRQLDLNDVGSLGRTFDVIETTGVLHCLADPEDGWARLVNVLRPGGAMYVMLYSKIARLPLEVHRRALHDLLGVPMSDDVLREARRRLLASGLPLRGRDFYTLAGLYDLLLHRHEDLFDIPRIATALERLKLTLLHFEIPVPAVRAAYRAAHPEDSLQRDLAALAALEMRHPDLYSGMYGFWCVRDA